VDLKVVTFEQRDRVAIITLRRPDRLNGWTYRMENEVRWCMRRADADAHTRVIVLTGAGRGFCAGADMAGLQAYADGAAYEFQDVGDPAPPTDQAPTGDARTADPAPTADPARAANPPRTADFSGNFTYLLGLGTPVIAAINGPAAGVGLILASFCDVRFAAAGAKLTTSFARLGLPAEHGISWVLPRLIGAGRAADMLLSSRIVLAEEALTMGLVNRVCSPDALLPETLAYADEMAALAPTSLRAIKQQLWVDGSLADAWQDSNARMTAMLETPEFAEGVAAFREKRPPSF